MKQNKLSRAAYAAGFFDGEGCIRIVSRYKKGKKTKNYYLYITLSQKDGAVVDWLYGNYGGVVYLQEGKDGPEYSIHLWLLDHMKAYNFLKEIYPFSIVKKNQIEIALRFQQRVTTFNSQNTQTGRFQPLPEHELEEREKLAIAIKEAKKQIVKSKNIKREYQISYKSAVAETNREQSSSEDKL